MCVQSDVICVYETIIYNASVVVRNYDGSQSRCRVPLHIASAFVEIVSILPFLERCLIVYAIFNFWSIVSALFVRIWGSYGPSPAYN